MADFHFYLMPWWSSTDEWTEGYHLLPSDDQDVFEKVNTDVVAFMADLEQRVADRGIEDWTYLTFDKGRVSMFFDYPEDGDVLMLNAVALYGKYWMRHNLPQIEELFEVP